MAETDINNLVTRLAAEPPSYKGRQPTTVADPGLMSLVAKAGDLIKGNSTWRMPKVGP